MMLSRFALPMLVLALPTTASAETFAIGCTGTSTWSDTITGRQLGRTRPLPRQVYVIDTDTKKVTHALQAMQEFEDVCSVTKTTCEVTITQGLISVVGHEPDGEYTTNADLSIDRATGRATRELNMDYDDGRYNRSRWDMSCERTDIPVFDKRKNKF